MSERSHGEEKPSFIKLVLLVIFFPVVLLVVLWFRKVFDDKPGEWK